MRLAIIISGSRRLRTDAHRDAISSYLTELILVERSAQGGYPQHVVVLHGAQKGADTIADEEARALGLDSWGVPYFRELDEPSSRFYPGGPRRNECVIGIACVLRDTGLYRVFMGAFPDVDSKGTHSAVKYAKTRRITADILKQEH